MHEPARTHEELMERSHQQDLQIQTLLRQYDTKLAAGKISHWINQARPREPLAWQGKAFYIITIIICMP
jgi:hypothetical protein